MDTQEFLEKVVSDEGLYCTFAYNMQSRKRVQKFHSTFGELIQESQDLDEKGYDSYFALSTFKESDSRKVTNTHKLKSFFLDLDCGEGKDYPNQSDAIKDLKRFCKTCQFPAPIIVNSGRGIHAYWALSEHVVYEDWSPVAERLKKLCATHDLKADAAVTSDGARVLRLPNTHNHKTDPPTPVKCLRGRGLIDFEAFATLVGDEPIGEPSKMEDFGVLAQRLLSNKESYFKDVLKKCAQMKYVWQNPEEVSEPLWFDAISIVKHCVDGGRDGAHKLSSKYSAYDAEETDNKYDTTKYVHKCETINEHRTGVCGDCPHWSKKSSPITLGIRIKEGNAPNIPKYPPPYFRGANGGIYIRTKDKDGETEERQIYPYDLYVTKRIEDPDEGESVVMRLHLPKDPMREFTIPLTVVTSPQEFRKGMTKHGVAVARMDDIMHYTIKWINELQATTETQDAHTQFGWVGEEFESFIVGDKQIFGDRIEDNPPSKATKNLFYAFEPKGTLEEWTETANFYNRKGFELHQYIVATSFGSPLMALTPVACGSLHLHSQESGLGKTTAKHVAMGAWGKPEELVLDRVDTDSSLMLRGEIYHNLPFYVDELTNADPKELSDFVYQLSSGRQRNRMTGGANLERSRGEPWALISVTSGNKSVLECISTVKDAPEAEAQRMMECRPIKLFDNTLSKALTDKHQTKAKSVYGHAGPIYIQWVINNIDETRRILLTIQKKIDEKADLKPENRFWSWKVACTLAGALIATKLGLIDYSSKRLAAFALELIEENKRNIEDMAISVQDVVTAYIYENWGNILRIKSTADLRASDELVIPETDPKIRIVGRYEPDTELIYLLPKHLKASCLKQSINWGSFVKDLKEKMGAKSTTIRLSKGVSLDLGVSRVLRINCSGMNLIEPKDVDVG